MAAVQGILRTDEGIVAHSDPRKGGGSAGYWFKELAWKMHSILKTRKKFEWIIHTIYGVKRFHSLRSEFHWILTPVEWKFTTQRVKSRPVHSIFTPKEVITDITTQGVKIEWIEWSSVREYLLSHSLCINSQITMFARLSDIPIGPTLTRSLICSFEREGNKTRKL